MTAKNRSMLLVIVGVVLTLASVLADSVGVGAHPDFGWKQIVGLIVGVVVAGIGVRGLRAAG
jgi:hypothetical protein